MPTSIDQVQQWMQKGLDPALLTATLEKPARIATADKQMILGVPRETLPRENRVALTPGAVSVLVSRGHQVIVEHNAGADAQYTDKDYTDAGALIAYAAEEIFSRAEVIVKIAPLQELELEWLTGKQTVISAVHLGALRPDFLQALVQKNITAIGFEFIQAKDGSLPIVQMISEIAGICSIQIASELLASSQGGKGLLLGGIAGVPPPTVTILGAGTVGYHAARTALGLGATVRVLDEEVHQLKMLEDRLGRMVYTAVAQQNYIEHNVRKADVLIGAIHKPGQRTPCIVTEEMVASMREGSVIVDVSIDQGGCIETSRPTTHDNPTFEEYGVVHYCVPNISARVSRTASIAISNILGPLLLKIGDYGGIKGALSLDDTIKSGIYVHHRHITRRSLANMFGLNYMDIDLLRAVNL